MSTAFVLGAGRRAPPGGCFEKKQAGPVEILIEMARCRAELTPTGPKKLTQLTAEQARLRFANGAIFEPTGIPANRLGRAAVWWRAAPRRAAGARPDADAFARTLPCDGSDAVYSLYRDVAPPRPATCGGMFHPGLGAAFPKTRPPAAHGGCRRTARRLVG